MTDVRRTGPPQRLEDRMRIGVPIEGEVDGIWQRAMQAEILAEVHQQSDLPGSDFFARSLTINPDQIKFFFTVGPELLPRYLDLIEAAIPRANQVAQVERKRLQAAVDDTTRKLHSRDEEMEQEMSAWAEKQPAVDVANTPVEEVLT